MDGPRIKESVGYAVYPSQISTTKRTLPRGYSRGSYVYSLCSKRSDGRELHFGMRGTVLGPCKDPKNIKVDFSTGDDKNSNIWQLSPDHLTNQDEKPDPTECPSCKGDKEYRTTDGGICPTCRLKRMPFRQCEYCSLRKTPALTFYDACGMNRTGGKHHKWIYIIPEELNLKVGDTVYSNNLEDSCEPIFGTVLPYYGHGNDSYCVDFEETHRTKEDCTAADCKGWKDKDYEGHICVQWSHQVRPNYLLAVVPDSTISKYAASSDFKVGDTVWSRINSDDEKYPLKAGMKGTVTGFTNGSGDEEKSTERGDGLRKPIVLFKEKHGLFRSSEFQGEAWVVFPHEISKADVGKYFPDKTSNDVVQTPRSSAESVPKDTESDETVHSGKPHHHRRDTSIMQSGLSVMSLNAATPAKMSDAEFFGDIILTGMLGPLYPIVKHAVTNIGGKRSNQAEEFARSTAMEAQSSKGGPLAVDEIPPSTLRRRLGAQRTSDSPALWNLLEQCYFAGFNHDE